MSLAELRGELKELRGKSTPISRMKKTDVVREIEKLKFGGKVVVKEETRREAEKEVEPKKVVKKESKVEKTESKKEKGVDKKAEKHIVKKVEKKAEGKKKVSSKNKKHVDEGSHSESD